MSNATRRQQDTITSKGKYWAASKLAPGAGPVNEKVSLLEILDIVPQFLSSCIAMF